MNQPLSHLDTGVSLFDNDSYFHNYDPSGRVDEEIAQAIKASFPSVEHSAFGYSPRVAPSQPHDASFSQRDAPQPSTFVSPAPPLDEKPHATQSPLFFNWSPPDLWPKTSPIPHPLQTNVGDFRAQSGQITPPGDVSPCSRFAMDVNPTAGEQDEETYETQPSGSTKRRKSSAKSIRCEANERHTKARKNSKGSRDDIGEGEDDVKREKFLERNRLAASKCRQKKKEWTENLEERARHLSAQNTFLTCYRDELRDELIKLKSLLLDQATCRCHSSEKIRKYVGQEAMRIAPGSSSNLLNDRSFLDALPQCPSAYESGSGASSGASRHASIDLSSAGSPENAYISF